MSSVIVDHLTLNLVSTLENHAHVNSIDVHTGSPTTVLNIESWEKQHKPLPYDLKDFIRQVNGLKIEWTAQLNDEEVKVGVVEVFGLRDLTKFSIRRGDLLEIPPISNFQATDREVISAVVISSCPVVGDIVLLFSSSALFIIPPRLYLTVF